MGVFSDDFAAVDAARNYATIADRKSKFGGLGKISFKADNYSEEIAGKK